MGLDRLHMPLRCVCMQMCKTLVITPFRSPQVQPPWRAACDERWATGRNHEVLSACQASLLQVTHAYEKNAPSWDPQSAEMYKLLDVRCRNHRMYQVASWHQVDFPLPSSATTGIKGSKACLAFWNVPITSCKKKNNSHLFSELVPCFEIEISSNAP